MLIEMPIQERDPACATSRGAPIAAGSPVLPSASSALSPTVHEACIAVFLQAWTRGAACRRSYRRKRLAAARLQGLVRGAADRRSLVVARPSSASRRLWRLGCISRRLMKVLHTHQRTGIQFLVAAHMQGGGILGDAPGIGKTVHGAQTPSAPRP
jgi:hypothetical protein